MHFAYILQFRATESRRKRNKHTRRSFRVQATLLDLTWWYACDVCVYNVVVRVPGRIVYRVRLHFVSARILFSFVEWVSRINCYDEDDDVRCATGDSQLYCLLKDSLLKLLCDLFVLWRRRWRWRWWRQRKCNKHINIIINTLQHEFADISILKRLEKGCRTRYGGTDVRRERKRRRRSGGKH